MRMNIFRILYACISTEILMIVECSTAECKKEMYIYSSNSPTLHSKVTVHNIVSSAKWMSYMNSPTPWTHSIIFIRITSSSYAWESLNLTYNLFIFQVMVCVYNIPYIDYFCFYKLKKELQTQHSHGFCKCPIILTFTVITYFSSIQLIYLPIISIQHCNIQDTFFFHRKVPQSQKAAEPYMQQVHISEKLILRKLLTCSWVGAP